MTEVAKLINELLPSVNDIFGEELQKYGSVTTNLPCDNFGFWLTQGVPLGIFFLHLVMVILGERDIGRCFVTGNGDTLSPSQERFVTEFCLDQAIHSTCYNTTRSSLVTTCSDLVCDSNDQHRIVAEPISPNHEINTLFIYRYHIWFLFVLVIIRATPQLAWRVFCKADIRNAVKGLAILAEFQHATCVIMTLNEGAWLQPTLSVLWPKDRLSQLTGGMNEMVIREVKKRAKGKYLFSMYVLRKMAEIALDAAVIALFFVVFSLRNRTPFDHLVFVCNLQREPANGLLCKAIKDQFIACTVSFGVEFVFAIFVIGAVLIIDCTVQLIFLLWFTRLGHKIIRTTTRELIISGRIEYWDDSMMHDLELERNECWRRDELYKSFMNAPNDLYLIGLLYRQSDVSHGQFLKMMSEKMIKDLHPNLDHVKLNHVARSESMQAGQATTQDFLGSSSVHSAKQAVESLDECASGPHIDIPDTEHLMTKKE